MTNTRKLQLLALHFILGYLCILVPVLTDMWAVLTLIIGTSKIVLSKNSTGLAHKFAFYIIGLELLIRNFNLFLPYEFGKYAVIYFLLLGRSYETVKNKAPHVLFIYFICLLPSIILVDMGSLDDNRKEILFNLSGPLELLVAAIYFYNRPFTVREIQESSFWLLCGMMVILAGIYYKMPSFADITFTLGANYKMSGGFGPNQVSSILGLGIAILGMGFIFDYSVSGRKIVDSALILLFAILGLLTFSRGGMVSAILALIMGYVVSMMNNKNQRSGKRMTLLVAFVIIMIGAWQFVDEQTGNVLGKRYKGETQETESIGRYSTFTGRDELARIDFEIFLDNILLGVGPGMATFLRMEYGYHDVVAAHTELTRLLAEHGIFGVFALLLLVYVPTKKYLMSSGETRLNKTIICVFFLLAMTTMMHAAMRTAMVGFFYGLALINLRLKEDDEEVEAEEIAEDSEQGKNLLAVYP